MSFIEVGNTINIVLHNIAFHKQTESVKYIDIISPFSRLYLVKEGSGNLYIENRVRKLKKGFLYLIPSYTFCSYEFKAGLGLYYLHFSNTNYNDLNLLELYPYKNKLKSDDLSEMLIVKLLALHPDSSLPHVNPKVYQNKKWINKKILYKSLRHYLETKGIIELLLARFISSKEEKQEQLIKHIKLKPIFQHIHNNLNNKITLKELADLTFLSKDHFARIFKSVTFMSPGNYILRKRIEKAQNLLLATNYSQNEIIQAIGFNSLSYFSRIFKKYTKKTPAQYRNST